MAPKHTSEDASFVLCSKLQIHNTAPVPQFPHLLIQFTELTGWTEKACICEGL